MVTISSLRTIPRAPKLGKKNHLKLVLDWAKEVRIWKPTGGRDTVVRAEDSSDKDEGVALLGVLALVLLRFAELLRVG